jgi:crotonobetainyl-CoA:carnitine CoA-transferase CaiB-like acyl-CoA transferase
VTPTGPTRGFQTINRNKRSVIVDEVMDSPQGRSLIGEVPVDVIVPIASYGAGVLGALAASAGLLVRALGSKGRVACYRLVEAEDGKWFFLACGTRKFYQRMLEVIGRPELIDDPALADPPWGLMLDEAIERLTPILDEVFATRPRAEWLDIMAEADIPAQPVLTREEFLSTSIVAANEMDVAIEHPELGPVHMMGLPFTIESAPGSIRSPAPLLDQHRADVLDQWLGDQEGPADPDLDSSTPIDLTPAGAEQPLAGVKVIDLASFIAGPVVGRHLAMLGADVVKIEPPSGDPFRAIGPPFLSWNQGKRSVAVDLTTSEGQAVLHQLVSEADIVIENFRPGVAARLGADHDTLSAINPDLVLLSSPGYGLDASWAHRPAFDPLIQSLGGFMAAQGGLVADGDDRAPGGTEPVFLSIPIHDVVTPLVGALGLVMALWQQHHRGGGQRVRTSLAQSTMVAQAAEYTRFAGRPPAAIGGFDHAGAGEQNTWSEAGGELTWTDGEIQVPICQIGMTASELARANELVTTGVDPVYGPLVIFGQLIGGAGPPPSWSPQLDEHGPEIRAELEQRGRER